MIRYVFREDDPIRIKGAANANPQVIGEALDQIRVAAGGDLQPRAVVNAARDLSHPLHPHFEWDDKAAAESFRLDQARNIIRIVRVVDDETNTEPERAFLSVPGRSGTAYRSVSDVKRSVDFQEALLAQADRELEAFQKRYRELNDICAIVRSAREVIAKRRVKHETRTAA